MSIAHKKAAVAILIGDKEDFKTENSPKDKGMISYGSRSRYIKKTQQS